MYGIETDAGYTEYRNVPFVSPFLLYYLFFSLYEVSYEPGPGMPFWLRGNLVPYPNVFLTKTDGPARDPVTMLLLGAILELIW